MWYVSCTFCVYCVGRNYTFIFVIFSVVKLIGLPAVVSSCADHVFVVVGEADVGHMSRVAEVALVFGLKSETTETCLTFAETHRWFHLQLSALQQELFGNVKSRRLNVLRGDGNSQTSLCRGSRTVWPIRSRHRWRCSGRHETHTHSSRQLCQHFEAKFPKLHLQGCCRGHGDSAASDSDQG